MIRDLRTNLTFFGFLAPCLLGFDIPGLLNLQLGSFSWLSPDLHAFVRAHCAFMALAHPFRYRGQINVNLDQFPPDAIKVHSPNTPIAAEARIRELASRLQIPVLCNSDAHSTERLGQYYNMLNHPVSNEQNLLAAFKFGEYTCRNNGR